MASSSTARQNQTQAEDQLVLYPASTSTEPYDIFINHHQGDVKHTLATTIHQKLHSMGFRVFLDVEALDPDDSIPAELQHAIRSADFHIAIFSPNYAQSPWCLAELSFILKIGAKIIPIFHHVEPFDLRWIEQRIGIYADAFAEHEKMRRYTPAKLDEWKRALYNISSHSGYQVNNYEDEARVLKNIVDWAFKVMKKVPLAVAERAHGLDGLVPLPVAEYPQGVDDLVKALLFASNEKVRTWGLVGMGGSGKTTLAKELFDRISSSFERCSFVFDVRDAASRNSLPDKQKKLLKDLGVHHSPFDNVNEGKAIIANCLRSVRALIVLDDVDHVDQLIALLPNIDNLGSQSMVIITTRELEVLRAWGISCIYKTKALYVSDAKQLFCSNAFLQPSPLVGYEELVENFITVCQGLPLSLKVLGRQLYGNDSREYWESQLHKIARILPSGIKDRLKVSYDALDEEEKEMFLDAACFFIGEKKSRAITVWDGSGWSGLQGFESLVNKSLVELADDADDGEKKIKMHDHLRDLGREIASEQSPYRIWAPEQISHRNELSMNKGLIRGVRPAEAFVELKKYMQQSKGESSKRSQHLRFLTGLQILFVEGNEFTEEFASLSEDLVWLRWEGFPLRNLPSWLTLRNLRVLELHGANELEELWEDKEEHAPLQLRELIITGTWSASFERFPSSISHLKHLKKISLLGHDREEFSIKGLPEEFCDLSSLEHLELQYCRLLSSLPARFGDLRNLQHLNMCFCKALRILPASFKQLTQLQYLDLSCCKRLALKIDILENITKLKNLYLSGCLKLRQLPYQITDQVCLRELHLQDTRLEDVPNNIGQVTRLESLTIGSPFLTRLPDSLGDLSSLKSLSIIDCIDLKSLPKTLGRLTLLEHLCIESSGVRSLPEGFTELANLRTLKISGCPLSELDFGSGSSSSLWNLRVVEITETLVARISITKDCCPRLEKLDQSRNNHLKEIEKLPPTVKNIKLSECERLKSGEYKGKLAISVSGGVE